MTYGNKDETIWPLATEADRQKALRDPIHALNFPADGNIDDIAKLGSAPKAIAINGATKSLERLAQWPPIENVWVNDMNPSQFARVVGYLNPLNLHLGSIRTSDFSPIDHMRRLEGFSLSHNTKLDEISFIGAMTSLKRLTLEDLKKPIDLAPVSRLSALEQVTLSGGIWNVLRVPSLAPLAELQSVSHVELTNLRVGDQSLAPFANMAALKHLYVSNQFPTETYAWLAAARPDIDCNKFVAYEIFEIEGEPHVMLTGKGKPLLKPDQEQRLQRYVDKWDSLVAKFKGDLASG